MLFHVTMTHTEDNCPVYDGEKMPAVLESFENLEALGDELGIELPYFTWCGPAHTAFVLVEADSLSAVSRYLFSNAMKHDMDVVPVEHLDDTVAMAKVAAER